MPESKVSEVKLRLWENKNNGTGAVAHGQFTLFEAVRIDCSVINGRKGTFVSLPRKSYKKADETKYRYTTYIEDESLREEVQDVILSEYNRLVDETGNSSDNNNQDNYPY